MNGLTDYYCAIVNGILHMDLDDLYASDERDDIIADINYLLDEKKIKYVMFGISYKKNYDIMWDTVKDIKKHKVSFNEIY